MCCTAYRMCLIVLLILLNSLPFLFYYSANCAVHVITFALLFCVLCCTAYQICPSFQISMLCCLQHLSIFSNNSAKQLTTLAYCFTNSAEQLTTFVIIFYCVSYTAYHICPIILLIVLYCLPHLHIIIISVLYCLLNFFFQIILLNR